MADDEAKAFVAAFVAAFNSTLSSLRRGPTSNQRVPVPVVLPQQRAVARVERKHVHAFQGAVHPRESAGEQHANIRALDAPPKESISSLVSFESRYGT